MTDPVYLDLISRFGGPATTVTVACTSLLRLHLDMRTEGEGASETGWQFTQLVLHPSQLCILHSLQRFVSLAGPPGCGKSLMLVLKALHWICRGKPALVLSTSENSLAASHMLFHQLKQTAGPAASGQLQLHTLDVENTSSQGSVQSDATTLMALLPPSEVLLIADEVSSSVNTLLSELHRQCQTLHLWTVGLTHGKCPAFMTEFVLTEPLRSPPCVSREVEIGFYTYVPGVHDYMAVPSPLPCDGPAPRLVLHKGQGHRGKARDCYQCGMEVARILQQLNVGGLRPALRYRYLFLLSWRVGFDDLRSPGGKPRAMLKALGDAGIPVTVLKKGDASALAGVATMSGDDHVVAAHIDSVRGLERPVVVWLQEEGTGTDYSMYGRLYAMSRCTAQLIWVRPYL